MRKFMTIALLVIAAASLSAAEALVPAEDNAYSAMIEPFQPLTARALGMGGAGVAVTGSADTFFINPAALASRRLEISLPSAQVTMYHIYDLVDCSGIAVWAEISAAVLFYPPGLDYPRKFFSHGDFYIWISLVVPEEYIVFGRIFFYEIAL